MLRNKLFIISLFTITAVSGGVREYLEQVSNLV